MNCMIYRSDKKQETYLFLDSEMDFEDLPEGLKQSFGQPAFVMHLEISANSKLARVDVENVLQSLEEHGYYLQLPPGLPVEEEISRRLS